MPITSLQKSCSALADPIRRTILERLASTPLAVTDLAASMPVSRSAVSQHLKILRDADLVRKSRSGRYSLYETNTSALDALSRYLDSLTPSAPIDRKTRTPPPPPLQPQQQGKEPCDQVDSALVHWSELWPEQDPIAASLSARLMFIARLMDSALEKTAARQGLSGIELMILGTLKRLGPPFESTPTNLAKASLLSPPGMSKRLDRLERRGLIERRPGLQDRRSVDVLLTKTGHEVIDQLIQQHHQDYLVAFQLPHEEQAALNHVLRRILFEIEERMRTDESG